MADFGFQREDNNKVDWQIVFFALNAFLVVYGYSLRGAAFGAVKLGRVGLVALSILGLFIKMKKGKYYFNQSKNWVPGIFIAFNLFLMVFSVDFMEKCCPDQCVAAFSALH